jgi:hypothetical protein
VTFILKQAAETPNKLILWILSTVSKLTLMAIRFTQVAATGCVPDPSACLYDAHCRPVADRSRARHSVRAEGGPQRRPGRARWTPARRADTISAPCCAAQSDGNHNILGLPE